MVKKSVSYKLLLLFVVFAPALINCFNLLMLFNGEISNFSMPLNDEISYYKQIEAFISSGLPLGYYGYNGSFAALGTSGPWGIAILLPYALIGKILGWSPVVMLFSNIFFLCLGNLLFALIANCDKKELCILSGVSIFFNIVNLYATTGMTEAIRIAACLVLSSVIIRIWRGYSINQFKYVLLLHRWRGLRVSQNISST